ncbi:hypothetical protein BDV93DRAFT_173391 [Ceratobasidium sp. AG-I]|nr:hypothetical protein BDV93DRAFT_173391 [Ceratobasidium sp. AG-I]
MCRYGSSSKISPWICLCHPIRTLIETRETLGTTSKIFSSPVARMHLIARTKELSFLVPVTQPELPCLGYFLPVRRQLGARNVRAIASTIGTWSVHSLLPRYLVGTCDRVLHCYRLFQSKICGEWNSIQAQSSGGAKTPFWHEILPHPMSYFGFICTLTTDSSACRRSHVALPSRAALPSLTEPSEPKRRRFDISRRRKRA